MLNAEMDYHLGGVSADGPANTRNGYGQKTVLTDTGCLALDIPRDSQRTFEPQLDAEDPGPGAAADPGRLGHHAPDGRTAARLMEIVDDRHDRASTIVTSQVPVELWHEHIGKRNSGDAVFDRLVHGANRIELKGESMRKLKAANK